MVIIETLTKLTPKEESLLRMFAESRDEEAAPPEKSIFEKVKDTLLTDRKNIRNLKELNSILLPMLPITHSFLVHPD